MKGTIRRRGERWGWQHAAPAGYGRKYISGTERTKREAQAALSASLADHERRVAVEPTRQLATDYLAAWLDVRALSTRPSTHRAEVDAVRLHIAPVLAGVKLGDVTGAHVARIYTAMRAKGLSEKTCMNAHVVIRRAFADAVKTRVLTRNPADEVTRPKAARPELHVWTPAELERFLDGEADHRLYTLWFAYATTGARRGEVLGLRWSDVDLDAGRASINRNRTSTGYVVSDGEPKSARSRRSIDLDPPTVAALRRWRKAQLEERLAWGPAWIDTGLVFTKEDGTGLHPDCVSDAFERAVRRSGLPKIRLHDLRHTWASLALRAGVNPKVVSERLGHASVSFTLDVYTSVMPGMGAEAAASVASLFTRAASVS